jgi:retinol dehydrogenase-12
MGAMSGKTCIVTGGSSGIGLETVRGLAREGAHVVIAVRDVEKGRAAETDVLASVPGAKLTVMGIDLASQRSIRAFVAAYEARFERLDVLVNNAALVPAQRMLTEEGLEMQFGVNHLGPFLLTTLLLPRLEASAPSRVVVVSSSVYSGKALDFDDLQSDKSYSQMTAYSRSKLANMLFTHALAKRLRGKGVTVNALHPGVVSTALARDMPAPFRMLARLFFTTPEKGARTSLFVATSPTLEGVSGRYFTDRKEAAIDTRAVNEAAAERLWSISQALVGAQA